MGAAASGAQFDPTVNRDAFASRCTARERDAAAGLSFGFGLFVDDRLCGEVNVNHVLRGALQTGTIGYWIDERYAGRGLVAEGVVVVLEFAFERCWLHRLEINIVPRNANSRRVMEKLDIRSGGRRPAHARDQRRVGGPRALRRHRRGVAATRADELRRRWLWRRAPSVLALRRSLALSGRYSARRNACAFCLAHLRAPLPHLQLPVTPAA